MDHYVHIIYAHVLYVHSYLRWLVLFLALVVLVHSFVAWSRGRDWTGRDARLQGAFVNTFNLQFVLGLLLYAWLSPVTYAFFGSPAEGMQNPTLRFFGVEHIIGMVAAIAVVHIGRGRSGRVHGPLRHRVVFVTTLVALLIIAASIPWPALQHGRPLFRGF
jgi:hypothetical protein